MTGPMTDADRKAQLRAELARIEAEEAAARAGVEPLRRLATAMHETLCGRDHTDGCAWGWEGSDEAAWTRPNSAHAEWFKRAEVVAAKAIPRGVGLDALAAALAVIHEAGMARR